jgi:glycosyltransferase involved in cell wall biosynthesis
VGSLRIALIAPPWFSVPPAGYGGTEWVVSILAEGLVERGHEVTLFASGGSRTGARLVTTFDDPPSKQLGDMVLEARHVAHAYSRWQHFDVIHDHTLAGLVAGSVVPIPVVHTIHGQVEDRIAELYRRVAPPVHLVAISEHHGSTLPAGCEPTVIHNGIDVASFPFEHRQGDYLLWVGRVCPEKGILDAIEIARRAKLPLKLLAKVNEPPEQRYMEDFVRPALARIEHDLCFQVSNEEKLAAYRGALATVFPIHWPEPFGLVMVESMATGTPVIAFRNGSVPEVIHDGTTGFICETIDEAAGAVARVGELDRLACREWVHQRFDSALNILRYEQLYRRLVECEPPAADPEVLSADSANAVE